MKKLYSQIIVTLLMLILVGCRQSTTPQQSLSTVNGVAINQFSIYNHSLLSNEALAELLKNNSKITFSVHDIMDDGNHYIIIDGTELVANRYSISITNGNILVKGSAQSLPLAIVQFTELFLTNTNSVDYLEGYHYTTATPPSSIYTKEELLRVIYQVYHASDQVIIGQQVEGGTSPTVISESLNAFHDATGTFPGVLGIDLGCYGIDVTETTPLQWSAYICDIVDYCANGGIVTISAHWANPSGNTMDDAKCRGHLGYGISKEDYAQAFTDLVTDGTVLNSRFKQELECNAKFLRALEENGVPVIWRPLHEGNGDWFWFCTIQAGQQILDENYYINLWKYVYNYFENEQNLSNLIWNFSPNYSQNNGNEAYSPLSTTYLYPGDDVCQMIGVDWYSEGNLEITDGDSYRKLIDRADKPGAITEFGPTGKILSESHEKQKQLYNAMDLYDDLIALTVQGYSFVYIMTWSGQWSIPHMGNGREFMETALTLDQNDVSELFRNP